MLKNDLNSAIADYTKAIETDPNVWIYYNSRASAYKDEGNLDRAIFDYSTAIKFNPKDSNAYHGRGIIYIMQKNYEKAWEDMNKAKELGDDIEPETLNRIKEAADIRKEIQYNKGRIEQIELEQKRLEVIPKPSEEQ